MADNTQVSVGGTEASSSIDTKTKSTSFDKVKEALIEAGRDQSRSFRTVDVPDLGNITVFNINGSVEFKFQLPTQLEESEALDILKNSGLVSEKMKVNYHDLPCDAIVVNVDNSSFLLPQNTNGKYDKVSCTQRLKDDNNTRIVFDRFIEIAKSFTK
jgi:hypothetical protein